MAQTCEPEFFAFQGNNYAAYPKVRKEGVEMLLESVKVACRLRHTVHSPNQALALMQSGKGRPASGVARFEECSSCVDCGWFSRVL